MSIVAAEWSWSPTSMHASTHMRSSYVPVTARGGVFSAPFHNFF